jgi:hypothetical protein
MASRMHRRRPGEHTTALARLPPTHPFVGAPILQLQFQVQWRARLSPPRVLLPHTCMQDGWFLQPKRRPARLPRRTVPSKGLGYAVEFREGLDSMHQGDTRQGVVAVFKCGIVRCLFL